jgi:hypothetical protein
VGAFQALLGYHSADFLDAMNKGHLEDRKALARRVNDQIREAIAQESEQYRIDLAALKQDQAAELDAAAEHKHATEWEKDVREEHSAWNAEDEDIRAIDAEYKRTEPAKAGQGRIQEECGKRTREARKRDEGRRGEDAARDRED